MVYEILNPGSMLSSGKIVLLAWTVVHCELKFSSVYTANYTAFRNVKVLTSIVNTFSQIIELFPSKGSIKL